MVTPVTPANESMAGTTNTTGVETSFKPKVDCIAEFKKNFKLDKKNYKDLKADEFWDTYIRELDIQAAIEGISQVLDLNYAPSTPEETKLDKAMVTYFYGVLNHTCKTTSTKDIVRKHLDTKDGRATYAELVKYMKSSAKADYTKQGLLNFIVNTKYVGKYKQYPAQDFVLLFKEKIRIYDEIHPSGISPLSDELRVQLLQSAVRDTRTCTSDN
jgi:hypothetical protein